MISSLSGNPIYSGSTASLSGKISGYVCADGGAQVGVHGFITEDGFGQYHLNAFDTDFSGNNLGFLFTTVFWNSSKVSITAITTQNVSGNIFPASGINTVVPISSISGVIANSGLFVTAGSGQVFTPILSGAFSKWYSFYSFRSICKCSNKYYIWSYSKLRIVCNCYCCNKFRYFVYSTIIIRKYSFWYSLYSKRS